MRKLTLQEALQGNRLNDFINQAERENGDGDAVDVMRRDESTPLTSAIERRRNRAAKQAGDHHFLLNPGKVLG